MFFRSLDDLSAGRGVADAGGSDAGRETEAVDAAATRPCAAAHTLCDDFDRDGGPAWTVDVQGAGELSYDPTTFHSPPRALHVRRNRPGDAGLTRAVLRTSLPPRVSRTRCELDLDVREVTGAASAGLEAVTFRFGERNPYVRLTAGNVALYEGSDLLGQIAWTADRWMHLALDYRWSPTVHYRLSVDGVTVVDVDRGGVADAGAIDVTFGGWFESGAVGWDYAIDDIVCDSEP